jgi:uncharacterized protein YjbI with pentapeptide repeats
MKRYFYFLLPVLLFCMTSVISAQEKPIQLSLFNPVQIFPENTSIAGLRLNLIYGKNANVSGLDLGLINHTTGNQAGIQLGGVNITNGDFKGWQWSWINVSHSNFLGLQMGLVNYHQGHFNGLQFSVVNYAETMKGLQLGLINIIKEGGFLPFFIIFNFDFD